MSVCVVEIDWMNEERMGVYTNEWERAYTCIVRNRKTSKERKDIDGERVTKGNRERTRKRGGYK